MVSVYCQVVFPPSVHFFFAETIGLVRDYIMEHPDVYHNTSKFIEGWGWDHTSWSVEEWPTAVCIIYCPRSPHL